MYNKQGYIFKAGILSAFLLLHSVAEAQRINRKALVQRHAIHVEAMDSLASLSVGNGNFTYTVDATGMQTFPDHYIFSGSKESVRRQIGMAVPVKAAKIIFNSILKTFARIEYPCVDEKF